MTAPETPDQPKPVPDPTHKPDLGPPVGPVRPDTPPPAMPPEPPTPAPVERPRPVRPVRPGRLAAEVSLSRLAGEVHAALGLRPVLAVDDAGSLVVSLPAEFDEASLNAVVAAHVPDPPVVDSLGVLAAGVEPARTIAELKTALLDYVAAERARRTPMKEGS